VFEDGGQFWMIPKATQAARSSCTALLIFHTGGSANVYFIPRLRLTQQYGSRTVYSGFSLLS